MDDESEVMRISKVIESLKQQSVPEPTIIVSPETRDMLIKRLPTHGDLYLSLDGYSVKVFICQKCAVGYYYVGSESQMFELLMRLQDGVDARKPF